MQGGGLQWGQHILTILIFLHSNTSEVKSHRYYKTTDNFFISQQPPYTRYTVLDATTISVLAHPSQLVTGILQRPLQYRHISTNLWQPFPLPTDPVFLSQVIPPACTTVLSMLPLSGILDMRIHGSTAGPREQTSLTDWT